MCIGMTPRTASGVLRGPTERTYGRTMLSTRSLDWKDALLNVVEGICTEYRVPYFAHRGNNSQTLQYQAGKRFANIWTKV